MGVNKVPAEAPAQPGSEESNVEGVHQNKFAAFASKVLRHILEQWLIIGFGLSCLFGYLWPSKSIPIQSGRSLEEIRGHAED